MAELAWILRVLSFVAFSVGVMGLLQYGGWRSLEHPFVQARLLSVIALLLCAIYLLIAAGQIKEQGVSR